MYAAIPQRVESDMERVAPLHRSNSWEICRAAVEMSWHGMSIDEVAAPKSTGRPVRPMRMESPVGRSYVLQQRPLMLNDRRRADVRLAMKNDQGSPPD